jgi:uncharacterized membrane-anchored protein
VSKSKAIWHSILALFAAIALTLAPAFAQQQLEGQVLAAGSPIAHATVTLFSASSGAPAQLSRTETATDGQFTLRYSDSHSDSTTLYIVAAGGEFDSQRKSQTVESASQSVAPKTFDRGA